MDRIADKICDSVTLFNVEDCVISGGATSGEIKFTVSDDSLTIGRVNLAAESVIEVFGEYVYGLTGGEVQETNISVGGEI